MNAADLAFDSDGRLSQVCVARWPDGAQIWREIFTGTSRDDEIMFEFREGDTDSSLDYVLSQVGLFSSFSIKDGRFHSMPGNRKEWNEMVPYVRWLSNELGFFQWPSTPMKPSDFSDIDPFVSWFVDLDAALSEARVLDEKLSRVRAVIKDSPPSITTKKAAEEIGEDSDLVQQIQYFVDSLLEPAWVSLDWSKLAGIGGLVFSLRKPVPSSSGGNVGRKNHPRITYSDVMTRMEAPSLVELIEMLSRLTPSSAVLVFRNRDDADDWFREHVTKGEFTIPKEEMEILRILDEAPPYLLPNDEFSRWVMSRIST